ncbi:hypothetical protein ACFLY0_01055 [Patescibacteria group bacterium]
MELSIYSIIFYLLLIDSVSANVIAWSGGRAWYAKHFHIIARYLPMAKGWATYYLILVVWIGFILYKFGELQF